MHVVDDVAIMRDAVRRTLAGLDGWVLAGEAVDGEHAVAMATELMPDVIVLDHDAAP